MAAAALLLRAEQIRVLLRKANFNPNQPRLPRGHPHGGRWVDDDGGDQGDWPLPLLLVNDDGNEPPKLPEKRPQSARERHRIARAIGRYLRETYHSFRLAIWIARAAWLADEAARDITTYFDEPKTLDELRDAVDDPKKGYDIHHIVEQGPARSDGFPEKQIQSRLNKVRIPRFKHWEINGWFGRPNENFGGLSPRDYLRGRSWEERMPDWFGGTCRIWSSAAMRQDSFTEIKTATILQRYADNGVQQDEAILRHDNQRFKVLFGEMTALEKELKFRGEGRLLMQFYDHSNLQLSLNAAKATLAVAPVEARHQLETIRSSKIYPQAADAGMAIRMLDRGVFKPK